MRKMTLFRRMGIVAGMIAGIAANVVAQTITLNHISDVTPCTGDTITASFTASQVMNAGNYYQAELEDSNGNTIIIGVIASANAVETITAVFPGNILPGNVYSLRVVSSDPFIVSDTETITMGENPDVVIGSNSPVVAGETLQLSATSEPGCSYAWLHPDGIQTSYLQNPTVVNSDETDAGVYTVQVTAPNGCRSNASATAEVVRYTVTIPALDNSICAGSTMGLNYQVNRNFGEHNIFTVQLSNIYGSFEDNLVIGESESGVSGSIEVAFPANLTGGTGFRVRIVSSDPQIASAPSTQFFLRPAPMPELHESGPLTFCEGESATITASGGIQYEWNNGTHASDITVSQTGAYTLTMTDQYGCKGTATRNVVVHSSGSAYIVTVGSAQICTGESVRLVAYDGVSYAWSNGATTQSITTGEEGIYAVTVTNNYGCESIAEPVNVTLLPSPDVQILPIGDLNICIGESVALSLDAGFENYFWNNGSAEREIIVSQEGEYTATVFDDNGCSTTTAPVSVHVHDMPSTPEVTYNSEIGELTCTDAQYYQWYKEGVAIEGAIYSHLPVRGENGLTEGTYTVEALNEFGCGKMSATYELFEVISGITQKEKHILSLYPNPNDGVFELNIPHNAGKHIVVTNSVGSVVYDAENSFEKSQIDLAHLKSGVYFLKAFDKSGVSSVMFLKN